MKVRRKSLWRRKNARRARELKKLASWRAAKERKRLARVAREEPAPDLSHVSSLRGAKPLFIVTISCSDGERVKMRIYDRGPRGLSVCPTRAGRKVACVLANYRPALVFARRQA